MSKTTFKLYLSNNFTNLLEAGEFNSMKELKREGKQLLKNGAKCGYGLPAREYCFVKKGSLHFCWKSANMVKPNDNN
jgi:hypothetical protein